MEVDITVVHAELFFDTGTPVKKTFAPEPYYWDWPKKVMKTDGKEVFNNFIQFSKDWGIIRTEDSVEGDPTERKVFRAFSDLRSVRTWISTEKRTITVP